MDASEPDDLMRRIRGRDPKALDRLLAVEHLPQMGRITELVGAPRVIDFVLAHIDRFRGETRAEFLDWLDAIPPDVMMDWLVGQIKAGDPEAKAYWLTRHWEHLRQWTEARVGVSPGHGGRASDVVQETAADLVRKIPDGITTHEQLLRWVRTTLRRRAIDLSRKTILPSLAPHASAGSPGTAANVLDRLVADHSTGSKKVLRREREECIYAASDDIPANSLVIVLLRQIDGCSLKAIAQGQGRSPVETARLYYQSLRPLREKLDHLDVGDWPEDSDTLAERLLREMTRLLPGQREAVELKHAEKYTLWEIAQVLGYDRDTGPAAHAASKKRHVLAVAKLLGRGMQSLRRGLGLPPVKARPKQTP